MSTNVDYRLLQHWSASQRAYGAARSAARLQQQVAARANRREAWTAPRRKQDAAPERGREIGMPLEDR
jgi:hypothetical protein